MKKYLKDSQILCINNFLSEDLFLQFQNLFNSQEKKFKKLKWETDYSDQQPHSNQDAIAYIYADYSQELLNILKPRLENISHLILNTYELKASSLEYQTPSILWKVNKGHYFPPHLDQIDETGIKHSKVIVATYYLEYDPEVFEGEEFCVWDYYVDENGQFIFDEFPDSYGSVKPQVNSLIIGDIAKPHQMKPLFPKQINLSGQFVKSFYFILNKEK